MVPDEEPEAGAGGTPESGEAPAQPAPRKVLGTRRFGRRDLTKKREAGPQFAADSAEAFAVKFLIVFGKAFRQTRLYPVEHPLMQSGLTECHHAYEAMVAKLPRVTLGARGGDLLIGNTPIRDVGMGIADLYKLFADLGIDSLVIDVGAPAEEMLGFLRLLASPDPERDPSLPYHEWSQIPHFRVNDIAYKMVAGDEKVVDKAAVGEGEGQARLVSHLTAQDLGLDSKEAAELRRLLQANPAAVATLVKRAIDDATLREGSAEARPTLARCLENLSGDLVKEESGVTFDEVRERLPRVLSSLPPDPRRGLSGRALKALAAADSPRLFSGFSNGLRASMLETELGRDVPADQIGARLDALAPGENELIDLAESVTRRLRDRGLTYAECEGRLLSLSQALGEVRVRRTGEGSADDETEEKSKDLFRARAVVVCCDPDPETLGDYQRTLTAAHYRVLAFPDAAAALRAIREERADMAVLELRLQGMHGLEFVQSLAKDGPRIPLILATAHPQMGEEYEIRTYPRKVVLPKPVGGPVLLGAVRDFTPQATRALVKEEVAAREQSEADLGKARSIQAKLLPESLPLVDGYDIGAYYRASREVGGDYYDVIPLGDGTYGLAIADVSGKGVSGAMGMVMTRGVLRMVAPWSRSAKETIVRLNHHLQREMLQGMFVTAAYAILEPTERRLTVCLAGHNPPLVYRHKSRRGEYLQPGGMALGLVSGPAFEGVLREDVVTLDVNDRVFFYTDGVVEAMSPDERPFGEEGLLQAVRDASFLESEHLIRHLLEQIEAHQDTAPQSDDITLVTLKKLP